jgi:hypothetical protein
VKVLGKLKNIMRNSADSSQYLCTWNVFTLQKVKSTLCDIHDTEMFKLQVWRLLTSRITFLDTKDLVCGALLIYYFR